MSEIQIRRIFLPKDAEGIRQLQQDAPEFKRHYPKHDKWLMMAISEVIAGKRHAFGVYKTTFNGQGEPAISLIGSIILKKETYTHIIQLKNLYIKPEERGRHFGKALFQAVEQFCIKLGCTTIETEVPFEESGTVNFLNVIGFYVQNLIESPYRKGDRTYRMQKHLPSKYTGDPFDLFNLSCWLFENLYNFRIVSSQEPQVNFVSDFRFDFQTTNSTEATLIQGSACVFDDCTPVSIEALGRFHKSNKKHLLSVIAREIRPEAKKFCKNHRILDLDATTIQKELRSVFAVELPSFTKDSVRGMIVPVNSKYFTGLTAHAGTITYFKGGPIGKYLKKGDLILFYVEESAHFSEGGIRAYAEIASCETDTPQQIWDKYADNNPIFPREEYLAWCVDKAEVVALTFSHANLIEAIPYGNINGQITSGPFDSERLGNSYLSRDEIGSFLRHKRDYSGLVNLDKSLSPKIFLSSTILNLQEERDFVIRLIRETLNYNIYASEASGADQAVRASVMEELRQSHIYICLVGERYGSEIEVEGKKISATHDEFMQAKKFNKFILVYVKKVHNRDQRVVAFLNEIGSYTAGVKYQEFTTIKELGQHITSDIARIVSEILSKRIS